MPRFGPLRPILLQRTLILGQERVSQFEFRVLPLWLCKVLPEGCLERAVKLGLEVHPVVGRVEELRVLKNGVLLLCEFSIIRG